MKKHEVERAPTEKASVIVWAAHCGCGWSKACPTIEEAQAAAATHRLTHAPKSSAPLVWS